MKKLIPIQQYIEHGGKLEKATEFGQVIVDSGNSDILKKGKVLSIFFDGYNQERFYRVYFDDGTNSTFHGMWISVLVDVKLDSKYTK